MAFKDYCSKGKCNVCGKKADVVVCASSMGAISYAYCEDCLNAGAEPYGGMVAYISCAGHFPEDINVKYQEIVRDTLKYLGKSEEQFIEDVEMTFLFIQECCSQGNKQRFLRKH